jgi:flagellar biogenesis protein FliO
MIKTFMQVLISVLFILMFQISDISIAVANNTIDSDNKTETGVSQEIPYKQDDIRSTISVGKFAFAGLFSLFLAIIMIIFIKRFYLGKSLIGTAKQRVRLIESRKIGPKTFVFLINYNGKEYLLAQAGESINVIEKQRDSGNQVLESSFSGRDE